MEKRFEAQGRINARILPQIPANAWNSTVAIVVADRPNIFQLGSATIFQIADIHFVVTAAHVVQRAGEAGKTVGMSGGKDERFIALPGNWMLTVASGRNRNADRYDLVVHRLSNDAVERLSGMRFLRLSDASSEDPGPRAVFSLFGYPGVWTYPIRGENEEMSVKPLEYTTYA